MGILIQNTIWKISKTKYQTQNDPLKLQKKQKLILGGNEEEAKGPLRAQNAPQASTGATWGGADCPTFLAVSDMISSVNTRMRFL